MSLSRHLDYVTKFLWVLMLVSILGVYCFAPPVHAESLENTISVENAIRSLEDTTPEELPPETPEELPPEAPEELPPETPEELPPETPGELPPETPEELPPDLPGGVPPETPTDGEIVPLTVNEQILAKVTIIAEYLHILLFFVIPFTYAVFLVFKFFTWFSRTFFDSAL